VIYLNVAGICQFNGRNTPPLQTALGTVAAKAASHSKGADERAGGAAKKGAAAYKFDKRKRAATDENAA
jgi:hypothetical protein